MKTRLVLIDRDGVINVEKESGYVESPGELIIYPRALEAFALLRAHGFTCAIVTNQSVVGRGRITLDQLNEIHEHLRHEAIAHGGDISRVYACTDHPDQASNRRKPGCGMLREAIEAYGVEASHTPMIGDALTDMQAAAEAGCPRYLVLTGKGTHTREKLTENLYPVTVCEDILDAARKIIGV